MNIHMILFIFLALVAVASSVGMLLSRNAVYSALYLIVNFATVAIFFLLLNAPFIAVMQVTVYAGAIMVLFLFVIMLLGAEQHNNPQVMPWQRPLAVILAVILMAEAGFILFSQGGLGAGSGTVADAFGSPAQVGSELYSKYLLPFEVTSVLLLVAIIGAVVLTKTEKKS